MQCIIVQLRTIIDRIIPTSQLDWLPSREINNCKHVALKQTTIEHVLFGNYKAVTYKLVANVIIYTIDILSGLLQDKLKLLEVLLWIYLINVEFLKFLIVVSTKTQNIQRHGFLTCATSRCAVNLRIHAGAAAPPVFTASRASFDVLAPLCE